MIGRPVLDERTGCPGFGVVDGIVNFPLCFDFRYGTVLEGVMSSVTPYHREGTQ